MHPELGVVKPFDGKLPDMRISELINQPVRLSRTSIVSRARAIARMLVGVSDEDRKVLWVTAKYAASLEDQIEDRLNDFVEKRLAPLNGHCETPDYAEEVSVS